MAKENIKSIVVDVRNTSEGMMEYAAKVIDLFVFSGHRRQQGHCPGCQ